VLFAGAPLRGRSENALARWRGRHVGIIFQFFQLIPTLTALENVLLALELGHNDLPRRAWRQRALDCLASVGVGGYARRLPSELSGGQQQRVAIARALANDPPVLVVLGILIGVLGLTGINLTEDTIFSAYAYSAGNASTRPVSSCAWIISIPR
jgi:predicted ABC-type transport system involved in lysophospholipase L1 biosynthesis ATPase subunit